MPHLDLQTLTTLLAETGARWEPAPPSLGDPAEYGLGYDPAGEEMALELRSIAAFANLAEQRGAALVAARTAPPAHDWRNVNGQNYVTPVRSQGRCGSCVAFAACATVETQKRIQTGSPSAAIDLSEAHLFFCHAASEGRNCGNGWWVTRALTHFRQNGVVDEKCFPYTDHDQACNLCADWQTRLTRISGATTLSAVSAMKQWLATHGPLATGFTVYQDFFSYGGGIYHHVAGGSAGGHAVTVVGYNDAAQYWIVKNSWGSGWGENGYFRIGYGECGIDAMMWGVDQVV